MAEQNPEDNTVSRKSSLKERFSFIAEILGFVVDFKELITTVLGLTGIASLLLASGNSNQPASFVFTNIGITPFHAFGLWLIACYTYLSFAREEWEMNKTVIGYSGNFRDFILRDLLFGWRSKRYSVTAITVIFLLIWNIVEMVKFAPQLLIVPAVLAFVGFFLWLFHLMSVDSSWTSDHDKQVQSFSKEVEANWDKWDRLVQQRLSGNQWISAGAFKDLRELHGLYESDIYTLLLAAYALKHPKTTYYGRVFSNENDTELTYDVLVNLRKLDRNRFYFK